jgi:hypothetical protein
VRVEQRVEARGGELDDARGRRGGRGGGEVRQALADIGFSGWATAEVGGGEVARLTEVRKQMEQALYG